MPFAARSLIATALLMLISGVAVGQAYPTRTIRMVVPSAAGTGITDMMARFIAPPLSESLGQQIVIDNRPGAGGILGADIAAKAAPDGYTLLMANISLAVNLYLYPTLPFDPVRDFQPITMVNSAPLLLVVHPTVSANSVQALIALAKAHPGEINYASGGVGSTPHLAGELFKALAGIDVVHVPYKSGPPALSDLVAGQVSFMLENMPGTMPFVRQGKLRALAITSSQRSPLAPDLPTVAEAGVPGYEYMSWFGLLAPAKTAPEIVARLNADIVAILAEPEIRKRLIEQGGVEPVGSSPDAFAAIIRSDLVRYAELVKRTGAHVE
jgi:tripartite-type tricarboxylate transporter receptor subunit TctC